MRGKYKALIAFFFIRPYVGLQMIPPQNLDSRLNRFRESEPLSNKMKWILPVLNDAANYIIDRFCNA